MADTKWKETTGVSDYHARVTIVCHEDDAETWMDEADENGYGSRSKYLYELIQEARAYREEGFLSHHESEEKIEELQQRIKQLETQLEEKEKEESGQVSIDDPAFIQRFLGDEHRPLKAILQDIIESGALDDLLRKPIENQLYFLAQQGEVEYERGHGWKRSGGED